MNELCVGSTHACMLAFVWVLFCMCLFDFVSFLLASSAIVFPQINTCLRNHNHVVVMEHKSSTGRSLHGPHRLIQHCLSSGDIHSLLYPHSLCTSPGPGLWGTVHGQLPTLEPHRCPDAGHLCHHHLWWCHLLCPARCPQGSSNFSRKKDNNSSTIFYLFSYHVDLCNESCLSSRPASQPPSLAKTLM